MAPGRCIIAGVWIDTHCHLDAADFDADRDAVVAAARAAGVATIVLPAVDAGNFDRVRELAHRHRLAYALGIHPMCTGRRRRGRPGGAARARSRRTATTRGWWRSARSASTTSSPASTASTRPGSSRPSSKLAREFDLPVLLHVRRAVDSVLKQLRTRPVRGGIAHAFNGSEQQAGAFVALGFKLGFGGALTFDRALRIRRVAGGGAAGRRSSWRPMRPDIAPQWLYRTAEARAAGATMRNDSGRAAAHRRRAGRAARHRRPRRWPPRPPPTRSRRCRASPSCTEELAGMSGARTRRRCRR